MLPLFETPCPSFRPAGKCMTGTRRPHRQEAVGGAHRELGLGWELVACPEQPRACQSSINTICNSGDRSGMQLPHGLHCFLSALRSLNQSRGQANNQQDTTSLIFNTAVVLYPTSSPTQSSYVCSPKNTRMNDQQGRRGEAPRSNGTHAPSVVACTHTCESFRKEAAPTPIRDIMRRPGSWNRAPPRSPPGIPVLTAPSANDTCTTHTEPLLQERSHEISVYSGFLQTFLLLTTAAGCSIQFKVLPA